MEKKKASPQNGIPLYFGVMCLIQFVSQVCNGSQGVLLSDHIAFYSLTSAAQGAISTCQSAGAAIAVVSLIFLSGRLKNHTLILLSLVCVTAAMGLLSFAPPFAVMLLLYLVFGLGFGSISSVTSAEVATLYPGDGGRMGILHACFGVGGFAGPMLLQYIRSKRAWTGVCGALFFMALFALAFFTLVLGPGHARDKLALSVPSRKVHPADIRRYLSARRNWLLFLSIFGYSAFQNGFNIWIVRYFSNGLGFTGNAALALSLFWVANTVSRVLTPRLPLKTEETLLYGFVAASIAAAAGVLSGSPGVMFCCVVLAGLFSGAAIPQFYHLNAVYNPEIPLVASSFTSIMMYVSWTVTAPITALLTGGGNWRAGMLLISFYVLIGGLAMLPAVLRMKKGRA